MQGTIHVLVYYEERTGALNAADFDFFMNCRAIKVDQQVIPNPCSLLNND
jgi:hypothetical protein